MHISGVGKAAGRVGKDDTAVGVWQGRRHGVKAILTSIYSDDSRQWTSDFSILQNHLNTTYEQPQRAERSISQLKRYVGMKSYAHGAAGSNGVLYDDLPHLDICLLYTSPSPRA